MIYILRHGQTDMNRTHSLQGRSDQPLNEAGRQQALKAREWFTDRDIVFSAVYSSPLIRAVESARLASGAEEICTDERLLEMDYGPYEGMDLHDPRPEVMYFFQDFVHHPAPEGMEQLSDVVRRTGEFIEEIRTVPGNVLISTHAIAMKGILEYLTPGSDGAYWSKYIGNCAVYAVDNRDGILGIPEEMDTE